MELNHATQPKQLLTDLISRVRQVDRLGQNRTEQVKERIKVEMFL